MNQELMRKIKRRDVDFGDIRKWLLVDAKRMGAIAQGNAWSEKTSTTFMGWVNKEKSTERLE